MSSSNDSFQKYSIADEPDKELYSPFLNEASFANEEADEEWEMRLMELQTPFLDGFGDRYEGIFEPEVEESEDFLDELDEEEFDKEVFANYITEEEEEELEREEFDELNVEKFEEELEEAFDDFTVDEEEELEDEEFLNQLDEEEFNEKFEQENAFASFITTQEQVEDEEFLDELDEEEFEERQSSSNFLSDQEEELEDEEFLSKQYSDLENLSELHNQSNYSDYESFEVESSVQTLRTKIVKLAKQEWERWNRGKLTETKPKALRVLQEYYRTGVGERKNDKLGDPKWHSKHPWSAVFISWIMRTAGAGSNFRYNRLHANYIAAAKQNQEVRNKENPFWAFRITEVAPELGDLVCSSRANSGTDYDNVDNRSRRNRSSHCDIVTEVKPHQITVIGGNVGNTVNKKRIRTDDRGFVIPKEKKDDYFTIIKIRGNGYPEPKAIKRPKSLIQKIQDALRRGFWSLALRLAILRGQRDENKLTNLVFYARHPELKGRKIKLSEKAFAREWIAIRNRLVRPALRLTSAPKHSPVSRPTSRKPRSTRISQKILGRIAKFDKIINRIAAEERIDPNWIRGVIASESGGKPNSGAGTTGYKGLMQAERDKNQLDPETSIRDGTQKLKSFWASVSHLLRSRGINPNSLTQEEMIRMTMVAYNAGPGTLKKAMTYAMNSGDISRWMKPENFQRALIYYGAYSVRVALKSCLEGSDGETILAEVGQLMNLSTDKIREKFYIKGRWNSKGLWKLLKRRVWKAKSQWKKQDDLTFVQLKRRIPRLFLCSVKFKHKNLRTWYVDRVIAYMRYYNQQHQR